MTEYIVKKFSDRTEWYNTNGKLHREDGPAVEGADGYKAWWLNGNRHREDGPAVEAAHHKVWWLNGKLHREDGPAIEYASGSKEWFLNGKNLTEAEWKKQTQKPQTCAGKIVEIDGKKYKLTEIA